MQRTTKTYFLEWKLLITLKIYEDAINHCRWKKVLRNVIKTESMFQKYYLHQLKGKSFDEILLFVYDTCYKVKGIGMLIIYDITSAICRHNKINIERRKSWFSNNYNSNKTNEHSYPSKHTNFFA